MARIGALSITVCLTQPYPPWQLTQPHRLRSMGLQLADYSKSMDGGGNWSVVNTDLASAGIIELVIYPIALHTLYAGTQLGVFKSTNGGATWSAVNNGLIATRILTLVVDPVTPTTLYAGTWGSAFKSIDGGASWSAINEGLPHTQFRPWRLIQRHQASSMPEPMMACSRARTVAQTGTLSTRDWPITRSVFWLLIRSRRRHSTRGHGVTACSRV